MRPPAEALSGRPALLAGSGVLLGAGGSAELAISAAAGIGAGPRALRLRSTHGALSGELAVEVRVAP